MKRTSFRAVIIAAIIILSMTAAAVAAGTMMGWTDFLGHYNNVGVPQTAVQEMQWADGTAWQVGPLTFTVKELMTDGHLALSSVHIATTDGSPALLCSDPGDTVGCNGDNGRALAQQLGIDPSTTYIDAARQLNLPLYCARGILDLAAEYSAGDSMEDPLWNEDGSMTYFCLMSLNQNAVKDELPVQFFLRVSGIDPATGEETAKWMDRDQCVTIPVCQALEKRVYTPQGERAIAGFTLQNIFATRYITGAYLTFTFTADETTDQEQAWMLYDLRTADDAGVSLPDGMNLSASIDPSAWPQVTLTTMIGVDQLPEGILVTDGVTEITTH